MLKLIILFHPEIHIVTAFNKRGRRIPPKVNEFSVTVSIRKIFSQIFQSVLSVFKRCYHNRCTFPMLFVRSLTINIKPKEKATNG